MIVQMLGWRSVSQKWERNLFAAVYCAAEILVECLAV